MLWSVRGCFGCCLCQKRLRLSWKLDECKPLLVFGDVVLFQRFPAGVSVVSDVG
jgi:hypothetical protein